MTLNRIDHSNLISQAGVERFKEAARRHQTNPQGDGRSTTSEAVRPELQDRAEISETARRLMEIRQTGDWGRDAMEALPDVRDNKLAEARERLAKGYYNSVEVTNDMAAKLKKTFSAMDEL